MIVVPPVNFAASKIAIPFIRAVVTVPKGIWLNLHNPNLPVLLKTEKYELEIAYTKVEEDYTLVTSIQKNEKNKEEDIENLYNTLSKMEKE